MAEESVELVTVFETYESTWLAVAQSMLGGVGIQFVVENQYLQDIMAEGRIGPNLLAGPVRIKVRPEDAQAATEALQGLESSPTGPSDRSRRANMRRWAARIILLWSVVTLIVYFIIERMR